MAQDRCLPLLSITIDRPLEKEAGVTHAGVALCDGLDFGERLLAGRAAAMEAYRSHLGDDYSDLMGLGDEGVWTEVSHTVTYRKRNVTIQVQQPPEKIPQLKVVKAIFDKN